ncbi:MAG: DUF1553 domain-containing protein [Pedosphaera sp.]|nr:DUF1553 domain-containing protein [Pedosphaera sp.]
MFKVLRILSLVLGLLGQNGLSVSRSSAAPAQVTLLSVDPPEVVLTSSDQTVQLVVTLQMSDGGLRDVTHSAEYSTSEIDPESPTRSAIEIVRGRVTPQGDGEVSVCASVFDPVQNKKVTGFAKVTVRDYSQERSLNFANDIVPLLTKNGCNSGGCHGKASGQNGFHLSLLGFEPDFDYDALVREGRGRRVFPAAPDQSLLLRKASGQIPHGGGQRLDMQSDAYRLLRRWIVQGMPKGSTNDPKVVRIEVFPRERILQGGDLQQLRVVAYHSDGSLQDITRQAEYKSQQPDILKVDTEGGMSSLERTGEGAVMIRYMGLVDVARVTVPSNQSLPSDAYAHFEPKDFIDVLVMQKWRKLGIAPSPACSDEEFVRRAFLDAIGTLPTPEEVRQFLADQSPSRREKLVDQILERSEYASYWANSWGDLLRNKRRYGDGYKRGTFAFAAWIKNAFAQNMPYDQFVRAILTAQGNVSDNPPVVWYREVRNQVHQVNDTSQLFLGTRVACANCHHHPYERWSQDDYWGFAAFYARLGNKQGEVANEQAIFVKKEGETRQPRSHKVVKPKGLGGPEYDYVRGEDPRQKLAEWMTAPDNPYFAKAIVNRSWAHFMGVGLVEAVDDLRTTNPPSNPQLLDALAKDFILHKFDLKQLVRTIMLSRAYALSSIPTPYNATDRQNYSRYTPKRLSAEALLDAIGAVTGSMEKFNGFPSGTRALELPDEAVNNYFLDVFGRSQRETPCECERSYAPNLAQILHLMNSPEIQSKIAHEKGCVSQLLKSDKSNNQIVEELYLRAFARFPRPDEFNDAVALVASAKDRKSALEDFEWTLLNAKEFLFNH